MTDLGFGLADRRSVMVVLFTFLLSNLLFGYPLPIDITNAVGLFTSLVILTGFLFAARTVSRILLATAYTILRTPFDIYESGRWRAESDQTDRSRLSRAVQRWWRTLAGGISKSFTEGLLFPLFGEQDWDWKRPSFFPAISILGVLDRLLLIGIAFVATLPSLAILRQNTGLVGIGLLLFAYVLTGRFTIVLKDAFHKAEEDHDELVAAASHPTTTITGPIETKPYSSFDR